VVPLFSFCVAPRFPNQTPVPPFLFGGAVSAGSRVWLARLDFPHCGRRFGRGIAEHTRILNDKHPLPLPARAVGPPFAAPSFRADATSRSP
jgi:hypothetical protein